MKETEYIRATNRVKITNALTIFRDVLFGSDYGIEEKEYYEILKKLMTAQDKLFTCYKCEED